MMDINSKTIGQMSKIISLGECYVIVQYLRVYLERAKIG